MRRPTAFALTVLLALVAAAAAVAQSDPRLEKLRLTKADNALARSITVARADLGPGWVVDRSPAPKREGMSCPGYNPDLSRFTITGLGYSAFTHPAGGVVRSAVEVYPSRAQAAGDFQAGVQPGLVACLRKTLQDSLDAANPGGLSAKVVTARSISPPKVGERRAQWRFVIQISANGNAIRIFADVLAFQKGRSLTMLTFMAPLEPLRGQAPLARAVAARMR